MIIMFAVIDFGSGDEDHPPERPHGPAPTGACLDPLAPDENWSPGGSRFQSDEWINRVVPKQPDAPVSSF